MNGVDVCVRRMPFVSVPSLYLYQTFFLSTSVKIRLTTTFDVTEPTISPLTIRQPYESLQASPQCQQMITQHEVQPRTSVKHYEKSQPRTDLRYQNEPQPHPQLNLQPVDQAVSQPLQAASNIRRCKHTRYLTARSLASSRTSLQASKCRLSAAFSASFQKLDPACV